MEVPSHLVQLRLLSIQTEAHAGAKFSFSKIVQLGEETEGAHGLRASAQPGFPQAEAPPKRVRA